MKFIKYLICYLLFILVSQYTYSQEFYPTNFTNLITDDGTPVDKPVILNEVYILEKGFNRINDSLSVNPTSNERIILQSYFKGDDSFIKLTYYLNAGFEKLRTALQNKDLQLIKVNENSYQSVSNQFKINFILKPSLTIEGKKMNAIEFNLQFKKGTRLSTFSRFNFPIAYIYPFQNTTWFFTVNYQKSKSYGDQTDLNLALSKEKSPNKIEFLDDLHFRVTFIDKTNKQQILKGTYSNGTSIAFNNQPSPKFKTIKDKNGKMFKMEEPPTIPYSILDQTDLNKLKNTAAFYEFVFSQSYEMDKFQDRIMLNGKIYSSAPTREMPLTTPSPKNK